MLKKKERSPFNLEGAKLPLSLYTRRIMNVSLLKKYLPKNSSSGICGSVNLGNTCFMNSSIACLSNCVELTYYFLSGQYKDDINYKNKYGLKGKLAEAWYSLLSEYWLEHNTK
jgi:ubiquitin carboxyl-terminal hydrolase 4/11/15